MQQLLRKPNPDVSEISPVETKNQTQPVLSKKKKKKKEKI